MHTVLSGTFAEFRNIPFTREIPQANRNSSAGYARLIDYTTSN
jgi:hypothetical protein